MELSAVFLCLFLCLYSITAETAATYSATSVRWKLPKLRQRKNQFVFVTIATQNWVEDDDDDDDDDK